MGRIGGNITCTPHTFSIDADYLIVYQFRNGTGSGDESGFQLSAPQIIEAMAMNRISFNKWALVHSPRRPVNLVKKGIGLFIVFLPK